MGAPTFDHWHSPSCTRLLFLLLSCVSFIVAGCWNPILSMSSYISRPRTWYSHNTSRPTVRRSTSAMTSSTLMKLSWEILDISPVSFLICSFASPGSPSWIRASQFAVRRLTTDTRTRRQQGGKGVVEILPFAPVGGGTNMA